MDVDTESHLMLKGSYSFPGHAQLSNGYCTFTSNHSFQVDKNLVFWRPVSVLLVNSNFKIYDGSKTKGLVKLNS